MVSLFVSFFVEQVLMWLLYLAFATVLWIVLFPLAIIVATPVFVVRAMIHRSRFREVLSRQFRELLNAWMDLSIALIPL